MMTAVERFSALLNAFCPTGEGGGQDNSCPPGGGAVALSGDRLAAARSQLEGKLAEMEDSGQDWSKEYQGASVMYQALGGGRGTPVAVYDGDRVVAAGRWTKNVDGTGSVDFIGSVKKGGGSAVMAKILEDMRQAGITEVKADASPDAVWLNKKFGFTVAGKLTPNGTPMRLTLSPPASNAFCPTGEGGGQDNSCPPGGGSGGDEPDYGSDITDRLAATAEARMEFEDAFDDLKALDDELYYNDEHYLRIDKSDIDDLREEMERADAHIKAEEFTEAAQIHLVIASKLLKQEEQVSRWHRSTTHMSNYNEKIADNMAQAVTIYRELAGWHRRLAGELDNNYQPSPTRPARNAFCPTGEGGGVDPSCSPGQGSGGQGPDARAAKEQRVKERVRREVAQAAAEVKFSDEPATRRGGAVQRNDHRAIEESMTREERRHYQGFIRDRREAWIEDQIDRMDRPTPAEGEVLRHADIDLSESSRFAEAVADHTEAPEDEEELVSVIRDWEHAVQVDPTVSDFERLRDSLTSVTLPPREDGSEPSTPGLEDALDRLVDDIQQRYEAAEQELSDSLQREQEEQLDADYEDSDDFLNDSREYLEEFYDDHRDRFAASEEDEKTWRPSGDGYTMGFATSAGGNYSIDVYKGTIPGVGDSHEVQFSDANGQFSVTGAGGAHEVFSNVVAGVAAYAMRESPTVMTFSARGESRQGLYDKLVKTVSHALPEYAAIKVDQGAGTSYSTRYYAVVKRDKMEAAKQALRERKGIEPQVLVNRRAQASAADLDLWNLAAFLASCDGWAPLAAGA